jgi:ankyrin repeat protein
MESFNLAVKQHNYTIAKFLYKFVLNDYEKQRVLETAIINGNKKIVRYLYKKGIGNLNDALLLAVEYNHIKLVKYFVKSGASNTIQAFLLAQTLGNKEIADYLVKHL